MTKSRKIKSSIGIQLSVIMAVLVLISISSVILIVNHFMRESEGVTAEANNLTLNTRAAATVEKELSDICSNTFQLLDIMSGIAEAGNKDLLKQSQELFFQHNEYIGYVLLADSDSINLKLINNTFFTENYLNKKDVNQVLSKYKNQIIEAAKGKIQCVDTSDLWGIPSMGIFASCGEKSEQVCVILISTTSLSEMISLGTQSISNTYVVNFQGDYLIKASEDKLSIEAVNKPLVDAMLESNKETSQIHYIASDKKEYFGAYKKIDDFGIGVITVAPANLVYEAINNTTRNNIFLTFVILGCTILIVLVYTHFAIAKPLKILKGAVQEITNGNFDNAYLELLNTKRSDEIGILNSGVSDEREFLNTFSRFTNPTVATAIATKSIDFEPHPKDVSIFFSDIRGFTSISDEFKKKFGNDSASMIIGFLNDYMSRMVQCVTLSHGNIDKFEGDAIMAVWGLLREDDLSFENLPEGSEKAAKQNAHYAHVKEDAVNCITGSIAMRYALLEYNKQAVKFSEKCKNEGINDYKPIIKIGCGINTGRASVGLMGSNEKMEYTSIGDAVNFASRTEASNKACGTDILITEDTYNLLKEEYIRCEENNFTIPVENTEKEILVEKIPAGFEVKGKGVQYFYAVVNMPSFSIEKFFKQGNKNFVIDTDCDKACGKNGPKSLSEVRNMLGIPTPDFAKVNLNEDESKIQLKN